MSDWYKNPDTSTLNKLEALGESVTWVRDIGDCYVIRTVNKNRKEAFGFNDSPENPMYWKIDKNTGAVEWTDYVLVMNDIRNKPNIDAGVLSKIRNRGS